MSSICAVCSEEIIIDGLNTDATACGHVFHRSCIVFFIAGNNFCPYCKKPCSLKQLTKLRWHMISVEDQLELIEEMKRLNNDLLEKFPVLTNEMNEKDKKLDDLDSTLQYITEKLGYIRLETRRLKEKNYELKTRYKQMIVDRESRKPTNDAILEKLKQEMLDSSLVVRDKTTLSLMKRVSDEYYELMNRS